MKHNWEYKRLGDVCIVIGGSTPKTDVPEYWDGENNWFTPAEINGSKYYSSSERKITDEAAKATGLTLMPSGTVLLTSRAPIGKLGILTEEAYCNQGFKNLVCKDGLYNEYLYYALIYFNEEIKDKGRGATFKEISKKITESIAIPVPPMEIQERIVAELDEINGMIEVKREQLKQLDLLSQSIFYTMFGDPVTNSKGWSIFKIGDLTAVQTGATPSREDGNNYIGNIPWVKTTEVHNCRINSSEEHISEVALSNSNCKIFPIDTIILAMYGQGKTRGQVARLDIEASTNQACAAILPCKELNPTFLYHFLITQYEPLRNKAVGGNQKNLNLSIIKDYNIILSPLALQEQFAAKVEAIETRKANIEATIKELQMLLDSRMDYWFN